MTRYFCPLCSGIDFVVVPFDGLRCSKCGVSMEYQDSGINWEED